MEDIDKLLQINADLCSEIEIFRKNFEICRENYATVVKRLKNNASKITEKDLPHFREKHEYTSTAYGAFTMHECKTCNIKWTSESDIEELYLSKVRKNIFDIQIPQLYQGNPGWIKATKLDNVLQQHELPRHVTSYRPADRKAYRDLLNDDQ